MRVRSVRWMLAAVVLVAGLGAARMILVHQETWEWRWTPSATPAKLHVLSRDYRREDRYAVPPPPARRLAESPAGAPVLGNTQGSFAPTVIWVRSHQAYEVYTLMGGP